ncbi:MAG: alpha/beta hydrolase [Gammaproteobacteria bacterium]|nr:alpha/beta hydrolase [Gammaproteobacteria bacterium]
MSKSISKTPGPDYEDITGRYFNLETGGVNYRLYVEEAGQGIPLVCLHTAGSDARQFRHILCDREITANYRVIAFDAPWHGKSNPPSGWQDNDYQLTSATYKDLVQAFCAALGLDQPVLMGCSMGGRIVLHLALSTPDDYRAVIALEGADRLQPYYDTSWLNRPDIHGGMVSAGFVSGQVAPQSPLEYRWETLWAYMQSGPGIFEGDLHFYWQDGDFDDRSGAIDTDRCPVYLLSGEYDNSCTPERAQATASRIKGSKLTIMSGMGHFPMSENPELFRQHLLPLLEEIAGESAPV